MELSPATKDRLILAAAGAILENPETHLAQWQQAHSQAPTQAASTGLAQAGDFGPDVLTYLAHLVQHTWHYGVAFVGQNKDELIGGALVNYITHFTLKPGTKSPLSTAELQDLSKTLAPLMADELRAARHTKR